jgi:hypothetical protein
MRAGDQHMLLEADQQSEQSLRSSQARLAGILDIADDAIISVDDQGQHLHARHPRDLIVDCGISLLECECLWPVS